MPRRNRSSVLITFLTCLLALTLVANAAGQGAASDQEALHRIATALFDQLPEIAENPDNPVTADKVELGKMLYFEPRLSKSGFISCNSCHNIATGGVDNLPTSLGHLWAVGPRNAPTTLNAAVHGSQFWDGRAPDVEAQAQGPVLNPIEMGVPHEGYAVDRIASIPEYVELFEAVFAGEEQTLTYANIANAIGAYERTLITSDRFDEYLGGDFDALDESEVSGLQAFVNLGCAGCHSGAALGGNMFARFGIVESYWEATREVVVTTSPTQPMDVGLFAVTHNSDDLYVFKVPSLRNITRTYPYFHDGSVWDLRDATQIMARVQLGRELDDETLDDLMAFLGALDGELPLEARILPILPVSTGTTQPPEFR